MAGAQAQQFSCFEGFEANTMLCPGSLLGTFDSPEACCSSPESGGGGGAGFVESGEETCTSCNGEPSITLDGFLLWCQMKFFLTFIVVIGGRRMAYFFSCVYHSVYNIEIDSYEYFSIQMLIRNSVKCMTLFTNIYREKNWVGLLMNWNSKNVQYVIKFGCKQYLL